MCTLLTAGEVCLGVGLERKERVLASSKEYLYLGLGIK